MPDGTGTLIAGRYQLTEPADGGRVWYARDQLLAREVALRKVPLPPGASAELRAWTLAQAQAAARLDHPNLVPIYDVAVDGDVPWMVMRPDSGPSLRTETARRGSLPWPRVARIGQQVAAALACAHAAGVVHGELTAGSVLLDDRATDHVVVTGFGSIGAVSADDKADDKSDDQAIDLYALGTMLYTAVEGRPPAAAGPLAPPRHAGPMRPVLESLLAADPAQRPTAEAVAATLAGLTADTWASAGPAADQPPLTAALKPARGGSLARLAGPVRPRSALTVGTISAVVMVIAVVLIVFVLGKNATSKPAGSVASATLSGVLTDPDGYRAQDVAFSPDGSVIGGSFVASGGSAAHVDLWSSGGGAAVRTLSDPTGEGTLGNLAFSPTNSNALAVAGPGGIELWSVGDHSVRTYRAPDSQQAVSVSYAPDGKSVAESSSAGGVYQLDTASGQWTAHLTGGNAGGQVAVSPNGQSVAAVSAAGQVRVWAASGGAPQVITGAFTGAGAQAIAFSPDSRALAYIQASGAVEVRDLASGKASDVLADSGSPAVAVAFSPNGTTVAVGRANGSVYFWDPATGNDLTVSLPAGSAGAVTSLAFSPDGKTLAAASDGGARVYLFNLKYTAS
jgi:Protein kinase domain/WD domain, G-beta repeat